MPVIPAIIAAGVAVIALVLLVVLLRAPFLIDWVRYSDVDGQCSGVIVFSGEVDGVDVDGRHCLLGPDTVETREGYSDSFELASRGRLVVFGQGPPSPEGGPIGASFLRLPGQPGRWYCAAGGRYGRGEGEGEFVFERVSEMSEQGGKGELSVEVTASGEIVEVALGDRALSHGGVLGHACIPGNRRCTLELGDGAVSLKVMLRTWIGMRTADHREIEIGDAVVVFEERGASGQRLVTSIQPGGNSTIAWSTGSNLLTLRLRGLSEPMACPPPAPGEGAIEGDFSQ